MLQSILNVFKHPVKLSPFIKVSSPEYASAAAIVTIDRPQALNAINGEMFR